MVKTADDTPCHLQFSTEIIFVIFSYGLDMLALPITDRGRVDGGPWSLTFKKIEIFFSLFFQKKIKIFFLFQLSFVLANLEPLRSKKKKEFIFHLLKEITQQIIFSNFSYSTKFIYY